MTELDDDSEPTADAPSLPPQRITMPRLAAVWWLTGPLFVIGVIATVVFLVWPAPYTIDAPGNAYDTRSLVTVGPSVKTYAHPGEFLFVTVSETTRPIFLQALTGWLDPDVDVFPTSVASQGLTAEQDKRYSAVLMDNSKQSAAYQALGLLGYAPTEVANGVFIDQIEKGSPADGTLLAGDTITSIATTTRTTGRVVDDDPKSEPTATRVVTTTSTTKVASTPIYTTQDLQRFLTHVKPGQKLDVTVDRTGVSLTHHVSLTVGSKVTDGKKLPYLGIYMETRPNFKLPFGVAFDTGDVGGPSAGLALTLSLVDKLTPKGITKGNRVAVTGTMQLDGSVGPVGGIIQKTKAVRNSGARYFLVPPDEFKLAKAHAGSKLKVIEVTSLKGALAVLKGLPAVK